MLCNEYVYHVILSFSSYKHDIFHLYKPNLHAIRIMQLAKRPISSNSDFDVTKKQKSEATSPGIAAKREAATRRLQTVWESIIARYSEPDVVANGDIVDLETGVVLQDNGHLRSIDDDAKSLWTVKKSSKLMNEKKVPKDQNMFTSILEIEDSQEEEIITIEQDEEDELQQSEDETYESGVDLSTFGLDESDVETTSPTNHQLVPDIRSQMSQKMRQLQVMETARLADNLRNDYDRLLLPSEVQVGDDEITTEQVEEERFFSFFNKPKGGPNMGFFYHADMDVRQLN